MKVVPTKRLNEVVEMDEVLKILDTCKILHLGMVDGDEPYVVAMNYGYVMEDGELTLYLHGAVRGRKLDVLRANPKVYFEMSCDVTPFEGKTACQYGVAYSYLKGKGAAEIVEDVEEKKKGLAILMKTQSGKDFEFTDRLVGIVSVIKIKVFQYDAKHRPLPAVLREDAQ